MLIECCVDNVGSALTASVSGADRLELCANLIIGGTTPDINLFYAVKEKTKELGTKINVLIRPRFGDFCYSDDEFEIILKDAEMFYKAGADGLVFGTLNADGSVDEEKMRAFTCAANGLPITFHRAFDVSNDAFEALDALKRVGVSTLLTSGQKSSALEGFELIKELVRISGDIVIMPGGGVNSSNLKRLAQCGASAYHMSGKKIEQSRMRYRKADVPMGIPGLDEFTLWMCDGEEIKKARYILDTI